MCFLVVNHYAICVRTYLNGTKSEAAIIIMDKTTSVITGRKSDLQVNRSSILIMQNKYEKCVQFALIPKTVFRSVEWF